MSKTTGIKQERLVPWFGSDCMMAKEYAAALNGCEWVGVLFAGGMSIIPHLKARGLLVNDLHRDVINLARVTADDVLRKQLIVAADAQVFHPDTLEEAQDGCRDLMGECDYIDGKRALDYFTAAWMGRSGQAGTDDELNGNLAMRFTASGGGSNTRYRSAVESLEAWGQTLKRCEFSCLDWRVFLTKCQDRPKHGLYVDAPWPKDGGNYRHKFTEQDQRDLAAALSKFDQCRVVVRYGDHPLIRELYPESKWTWKLLTSRTQGNNDKAEALIVNKVANG